MPYVAFRMTRGCSQTWNLASLGSRTDASGSVATRQPGYGTARLSTARTGAASEPAMAIGIATSS